MTHCRWNSAVSQWDNRIYGTQMPGVKGWTMNRILTAVWGNALW